MSIAPRVTANASRDLAPQERWCTCCEQPLAGKFAWLEYDQRTGVYHDHGDVPEDQSQGWFPFGMTCARNKLAIAAATMTAPPSNPTPISRENTPHA